MIKHIRIVPKWIIFSKWSVQNKYKSSEIGFLRKAIYFLQVKEESDKSEKNSYHNKVQFS